jgi:hypothetical protein
MDFVYEQNVLRFSERLQAEDDPATRKILSKLLLEEENKFAVTSERLDNADRHIARCKSLISLQYTVIDNLKNDGHDTQRAERLLRNMMELHDVFVSYRQTLLDGLNRGQL